ncbi:uncharacterized protein LOC121415508 isoform X2 [Lytechinus variegatus]|uniref:uncharacterized protein LOC121415508 isoform X2 n=1 Tax=Lytechinus variegatus TaxID=7654 RepID=UPI001BB19260|nr:uncharacterized protein LOC121415508 isoform X2 [Lytechinus variegatus]
MGDMSSEEEDSDDGGGADMGGDLQYGGYQLLMQDPEHVNDDSEDGDEDSEEMASAQPQSGATGNLDDEIEQDLPHTHSQYSDTNTATDPSKPNLPTHLAKLLPSVNPSPDAASQVMHTDTRVTLEQRKEKMAGDDQIRAAMAKISLPVAAIPSWARAVDESDWKEQLVARIQCKHEKQQLRTATQLKGTSTKR